MKTRYIQFLLAPIFFIVAVSDSFARPTPSQLEKYVLETAIFIESEYGSGSGVVFRLGKHPKVKYVLTAHHVVADALENGSPITLRSRAQPDLKGEVKDAAGWHVANDVASVRLPKNMYALRALRLSTMTLQPSNKVAIYSFPGGKFGNFIKTLGVIESVGMEYVPVGGVDSGEYRMAPKYRFSNFVLGGSSGGMMVNRWAHLMGIVTHGSEAGDGNVLGGLGTPSTVIVDLIKAAMKKGWSPENATIFDKVPMHKNLMPNVTRGFSRSSRGENAIGFGQGLSAKDVTGGVPNSQSSGKKEGRNLYGWFIFWITAPVVILGVILALMVRVKSNKEENSDANQSQVQDENNSK